MKTRVHVTIDTEFDIAKTFRDPSIYKPIGEQAVYCRLSDGRSSGLGFLLETFARFGISATFFVEALNTYYFGDETMGDIAREISTAGHSVQLHLHPCWAYFSRTNWAETLASDPPNDDITRRTVDEIECLIRIGQDIFQRWGLTKPEVLRTGGLRVNSNVYEAMKRCGIMTASNVGLAVYRPAESALQIFGGCHRIYGIREFPVMTFSDLKLLRKKHLKTLTITGTSYLEMSTLLKRARMLGITDVVVLTHPFEYIKHRDIKYERIYPDHINRNRLAKLCEFLAEEPGFEASRISAVSNCVSVEEDRLLSVPPWQAAIRILVNRVNHSVMRL